MSTTAAQSVPAPRRASVTDVARLAGVSVGTVSNVLNRPERVSEAMRQRVEAAIEALHFVPNVVARQLRVGAVKTVGVVVLDLTNPFFMEMAGGLQGRLEEDGWTMMLAASAGLPKRESRFLRRFEEQGVAGVAAVWSSGRGDELHALVERGIGVVLLDSPSAPPGISWVAVDDVAGGRMVAEHLLALGHRRIALLNGPETIRQCVDRRQGMVDAIVAAGLDPGEVVVESTVPLNADGGSQGVERILAMAATERPTAVFAINDLVALGVIRALRRAGVEIPGDMAVVGFDDVSFAGDLITPLTSVRRPAHAVGEAAANLLLRPAGSPPEQILYSPELVVRMSSSAG